MPPEPICVGKTYPISVITLVDKDISRPANKVLHVSAERSGGIHVVSASSDPSIGTLSPNGVWSGFDLDLEPGEARFNFEAKKAGLTVLTFTGTYKGKKDQVLKSIKVVNCTYKVTMNATDISSGGGVTIWTSGNLDTKITGDNGDLKGTASFAFDSGFVGPPCSISYSEFQNPTTITGQLDANDQLVLGFEYEPGNLTEQASCPGGGGTSTHTIDLTNTGIASATFPASGGTRTFRISYAGSDFPPGTMIIDVQPVSEEAGG
jgi:hypothetical protein